MATTKATFNVVSSALASGNATDGYVLTADGSGNVAWEEAGGGAVSAVANGADNRIATFSSSTALNGEANLTFTGTAFTAQSTGALTTVFGSLQNTANALNLTTTGGVTAGIFLAAPTADHSFGFQTGGTERMRLTSSGQLIIGSNTAVNSTTGLDVNSVQNGISSKYNSTYGSCFMAFSGNDNGLLLYGAKSNGGQSVQIEADGDIKNTNNSYGALSDAKLKENIVDANGQLDKIKQVQVRNYNLIDDDLKQIGMVAQELETIYPNLVTEIIDRDANAEPLETTTKTIKYSVFVPILIKSIQEQQALIEAQATTITDLTTRIETLENA